MVIEWGLLPKEIQDKIELKEDTDSTFYRFRSEDYTSIFYETTLQRSDIRNSHSMIASVYGSQGCYLEGTKITTREGIKNIEHVRSTDGVWAGGKWRKCSLIVKGRQSVLNITLRNNQLLQMTGDHVMKTQRGWVQAKDFKVGDNFCIGAIPWETTWNEESEKAVVIAMLLADRVEIPFWVMRSDAAMNGFLAGYFACNGSFYKDMIELSSTSQQLILQLQAWLQSRGVVTRILEKKRVRKQHTVYRLFIRNEDSLKLWVQHVPNLSTIKKVVLRTRKSMVLSSMQQQLSIIKIEQGGEGQVFDLHVQDVPEYHAGGLVSHNSGKSWSALALCKMLDPNFNVSTQVYYDYNKLVYDRASFKPGMAILVDEQSQSYGLDSHRVMIILSGIKEQLRKRSIHLIFCAPVLYEESKSSMYIIETMFIDHEEEECICALKTRDGLTLGHVRMPSPKKILEDGKSLFTNEEMEIYERKKDEHLDKLLGTRSLDEFEDRANAVMKHPVFLLAEKVYKTKLGYVPQNMVVQIINKIYPEYQAGVVPHEIAGRIKFNKETGGEWQIAGASSAKKDKKPMKGRV